MKGNDNTLQAATGATGTQGSSLLLIAVVTSVLFSLTQRLTLDFSAGHMDEYDYLFVGKTLIHGIDWPTYTYIFGADFNWYLLGAADKWLGGLTGARAVAAVLGLLSLAGVYFLGIALWHSRQIALCATFLLAVQSGHIFTSKLATYDAINFALFTLALAPLVYGAGCSPRAMVTLQKVALTVLGSLLMMLATLAKYTTLVYLPFIACALLFFSTRSFLIFTTITGIGLITHAGLHWADLKILYEVQISGIHGKNATYREIITRSLNHTWLLLLPSLIAIIHARSYRNVSGRRTFYIITALLLFSSPLFVYHLQGRNLISLYKHLNFANMFLSLSAAWLLVLTAQTRAWQSMHMVKFRLLILAAFLAVYLATNVNQLKETERGYPDVTALLRHIDRIDIHGTIISEDPYLFRYKGFEKLSQKDISETTWYDNDLNGTHTPQDVKDAVWDQKFDYVLLTDAIHPERNGELRQIMEQRGYSLQFNEPYALSDVMTKNTTGHISLYKNDTVTAHGGE